MNFANHKYLSLLLIPIFTFLLISSAHAKDITMTKMKLILQWLPQSQFAGYYVALEKGFYRKYGIDLEIINGGPDILPSQVLKDKKADFATMWLSTAIQKRTEGIRLVNIAQMIQRSSLMLVAKKNSAIKKPEDLDNKKVSIFAGDFAIQPKALFRTLKIKPRLITQSSTPSLFLRGAVDAASAMWYNEYHSILSAGINEDELTTFFYSDYNLNFPEDGIYVLEDFYKSNRNLCCAFVKASIEGWYYAFSKPEEAINIVTKEMLKSGVPASKSHQIWMLKRIRDLMTDSARTDIGNLSEKSYETVAKELKTAGLIKEIPAFADFYKPCQ
ncbi:MAG: ABC transporter substrate-binding protein [Thermodesulfovibrionales bacterium]|nr:ABC transporter substrate-binding protein [Thermodesulfovibrionales bacterium]